MLLEHDPEQWYRFSEVIMLEHMDDLEPDR